MTTPAAVAAATATAAANPAVVCSSGISLEVRHAWAVALATLLATLYPVETDAVARARLLEQTVYAVARRADGVRDHVVLSVPERQLATVTTYHQTCKRVHTAVRVNGPHLLAAHPDVTTWPRLEGTELMKGTSQEAWCAARAAERDYANKVLNDASTQQQVTDGFLVCRKCKSTNVNFDLKQTRSADEPMTIFIACNDCGAQTRQN